LPKTFLFKFNYYCKYVVDGISFHVVEFLMDLVILQLGFRHSDKISNFVFNVFMIIDIKIMAFIGSDFSIESHKEWFEDWFTSFEIEIHELHPENERKHRAFGNPM